MKPNKLIILAIITFFVMVVSVGCSRKWSESDKENAAHFFHAVKFMDLYVKIENTRGPLVKKDEIEDAVSQLEIILGEANLVENSFLEKRHAGFREAFRDKFQKSVELRLAGFKIQDFQKVNESNRLLDDWINWFEKNKRGMEMPSPSSVGVTF